MLVHADPVLVRLLLAGELVATTPEHPFATEERGWVAAGDRHKGLQVHRPDGRAGVVQATRRDTETRRLYNLAVAGAHTFFVGTRQWLMHNACWPPGRGGNPVRNAYDHWQAHRADFPYLNNAKEYVDAAHEFRRNPPATAHMKTRPRNGDIVIYDPASDVFAVCDRSGTPRTLYKLDPAAHGFPTNMDYFNAQ